MITYNEINLKEMGLSSVVPTVANLQARDTEIDAQIQGIANSVTNLSQTFATKAELSGYVSKEEISSYIPEDVNLSAYAKKAALDDLSTKIETSTARIKAALPDFDENLSSIQRMQDVFYTFAGAFADADAIPFGATPAETSEVIDNILGQKTAIDALSVVPANAELSTLRSTVNSLTNILKAIVANN